MFPRCWICGRGSGKIIKSCAGFQSIFTGSIQSSRRKTKQNKQAGLPEAGGFRYAVNDFNGNEQSHQQNRGPGNAVNGQYKVLLPDGRLQTVTYIADEGGYRAKVDYTPAAPGEVHNLPRKMCETQISIELFYIYEGHDCRQRITFTSHFSIF